MKIILLITLGILLPAMIVATALWLLMAYATGKNEIDFDKHEEYE
jgi:hypothetical protein